MSERRVLACCIASRSAFDTIYKLGTADSDLSEQAKIIFEHIVEYYDRDPDAPRVDPELLTSSIHRSISNPKHREGFTKLVENLASQDVSPANVLFDYIEVKREAAGAKMASAIVAGRDKDTVRPLLDEYLMWDNAHVNELEDEKEVARGRSISDIVASQNAAGLIPIWPNSLNNRLDGGLLPGHHMLIFARPEMGKTMMLVNMIAGFLEHKKTVLYAGNEDPQDEIIMRVVGRLTGMTRYEIFDDPMLADDLAREKGYDNLIMADMAPGTPRELQQLVEEYKPDVLLIDQLRNLNVGEDSFVQKLEKAAAAARNIAKANGILVVSVTQAGDSASGKAILDMGDVDSSNTGIPGAVDVMVGLGATREDEEAGRRVISLPKNKRTGRHDFFMVGVDPSLSKLRSLG